MSDSPTAGPTVDGPHSPHGMPGSGTERPGDSIGPFKLLEVLGEGGFGTVWLAERREPMVQRVALKIIKPGMDSRAVIARFEQERQALAVMDHPNVAKVLDGGVTPTGRPYFVMEHVKGEPITTFADRHRLTIRQRLELFIPVCEAVQHAHMKGIIHRDIKPSNILVASGTESGSPIVKVIDFGVAKAISHTLTDKTIFTEQGQIIGTPEYMSPEQAEMGAVDIDTRTDVYSLGIVLYELLSGTLPFDSRTLRSAGYAEIQRIIREVDPPKPSTKLGTADDKARADIANARQTDREGITSELRRELEWIPLFALRKDRSRRYSSPIEMAQDIRRYLSGSALLAGPDSEVYRARKVLRRYRKPLSQLSLLLAVTLLTFAWIAWSSDQSSLRLLRQEQQARQQEKQMWRERFEGVLREEERRTAIAMNWTSSAATDPKELVDQVSACLAEAANLGKAVAHVEGESEFVSARIAELTKWGWRENDARSNAEKTWRAIDPVRMHLSNMATMLSIAPNQELALSSIQNGVEVARKEGGQRWQKVTLAARDLRTWMLSNSARYLDGGLGSPGAFLFGSPGRALESYLTEIQNTDVSKLSDSQLAGMRVNMLGALEPSTFMSGLKLFPDWWRFAVVAGPYLGAATLTLAFVLVVRRA